MVLFWSMRDPKLVFSSASKGKGRAKCDRNDRLFWGQWRNGVRRVVFGHGLLSSNDGFVQERPCMTAVLPVLGVGYKVRVLP